MKLRRYFLDRKYKGLENQVKKHVEEQAKGCSEGWLRFRGAAGGNYMCMLRSEYNKCPYQLEDVEAYGHYAKGCSNEGERPYDFKPFTWRDYDE
jgi:hypothetical protein